MSAVHGTDNMMIILHLMHQGAVLCMVHYVCKSGDLNNCSFQIDVTGFIICITYLLGLLDRSHDKDLLVGYMVLAS